VKVLLSAFVVLAATAAGLSGAAVAEPDSDSEGAGAGRWADEVAERDELVAAQEALLNAYRCRFDIDTEAVAGGCAAGAPVLAAAGPGVFAGVADAGDVAERDALIASQEALLNVYRCRFDVDTEAVAGGCRDGVPATESVAEPAPAVLAVGSARSCAIRSDQTVACWDIARLTRPQYRWTTDPLVGLRLRSTISVPQPVGRFTAIAARYDTTYLFQDDDDSVCGIRVDLSLLCWGDTVRFEEEDELGQAGNGGSLLGGVPEGRFVDVALGHRHGCAIRVDQTLACWGANYLVSQRWDGSRWVRGPMDMSDPPQGRFRSVSTKGQHTCAIRVDLALVCWGPRFESPPIPHYAHLPRNAHLKDPEGLFTDVAVGDHHGCAIRADRTLACWGRSKGALDPPQGEFTAVASGYNFSCAIRSDQTIACWGGPVDPDPNARGGLVDVGQLDPPEGRFVALAAGHHRACAQSTTGETLCWGDRQPEPYATTPLLLQDKPDATPAPFQAAYEVPFGAEPVPGRQQQIARWVEQTQAWYRDQTGGRYPLFKRDQNGEISISVIVQETEEQDTWQMARDQFGSNAFLARFVELRGDSPHSYLDFVGVCGLANIDRDAIVFLHPHCFENRGRDFVPRVLAHELAHVLGAIPDCAPNYTGGSHVGDDSRDIMYQGPDGYGSPILRLANRVLDVGRDDYFDHGRDDCWDIARHPLLGME